MLGAANQSDAERLGRMLKFYILQGYQLGLYASELHFAGDLEAIIRNGKDIEETDFTEVFEPEPEGGPILN